MVTSCQPHGSRVCNLQHLYVKKTKTQIVLSNIKCELLYVKDRNDMLAQLHAFIVVLSPVFGAGRSQMLYNSTLCGCLSENVFFRFSALPNQLVAAIPVSATRC
jgi:hypothetical protein